ncbi:hypothetical protein ACHAL6_04295 [Proteiniclasticum sp. C24MP]|uniref:hypothetical protein n=1 Tax=Proteiniclasticum sp. C24MP TaxID=3374101 RepID=UPI003754C867
MVEMMMYIVLSVFLMSVFTRLYSRIIIDYKENITFLKHTDYAYRAFEVLKADFYTHTESFALNGNELKIRKSDYIAGNEIILRQRDQRLVYQFGSTIQVLCHDVMDVQMNVMGEVLIIKLIFSDVTYERSFKVGK